MLSTEDADMNADIHTNSSPRKREMVCGGRVIVGNSDYDIR